MLYIQNTFIKIYILYIHIAFDKNAVVTLSKNFHALYAIKVLAWNALRNSIVYF